MSVKKTTTKALAQQGQSDFGTTRALPFRLLKLTNMVSRPFYGQIAKQYSLKLNEWRTLFVLANNPGTSAIDISAATGLHPMNISRSLSALRKSGRITEAPDPRDLRKNLISLTKEGIAIYQAVAQSAKEHTEKLFAEIPKEQLSTFSNVVDQLIAKAEVLLEQGWDKEEANV
jgi:DNA-binding MarR family transcriptional regulator